jgi:hypothetical protein
MNYDSVNGSGVDPLVALLARGVTALESIALCVKANGSAMQPKPGVNSIRLPQQAKANTDAGMAQAIRNYIMDHQGRFTTTEYIEHQNPRIVGATEAASCAGRFQQDKDGRCCLAVTRYWFVRYAIKCGIDTRRLKRWLKQNAITVASVRLTPRGSTFWCYVIPEINFIDPPVLASGEIPTYKSYRVE